jgi:hypothetical protein
MSSYGNRKPNPMRELEWMAHYFEEHGREDLAVEILNKLIQLERNEKQRDQSNVINFQKRKRRFAGNQ